MTSEVSPFEKFPSFRPMFEKADGAPIATYMELLDLGVNSKSAVTKMRQLLQSNRDLTSEIIALLEDINWRPQIVAAVAMGLSKKYALSCCDALWKAFDSGSWVLPQLAAVAFLVDSDFQKQARLRIEAGCPINSDRLQGLDWTVRHNAAGPISFDAHAKKALSSLASLSRLLPNAEWVDPLLSSEEIIQAIKDDRENGGGIATRWLDNFVSLQQSL